MTMKSHAMKLAVLAGGVVALLLLLVSGTALAHKNNTSSAIGFSANPATAGDNVTITGTVTFLGTAGPGSATGHGAIPGAGTAVVGDTLKIQELKLTGVGVPCGTVGAAFGDIASGATNGSGQFSTVFDTTSLGGSTICFRALHTDSGGPHGNDTSFSPGVDLVINAAAATSSINTTLHIIPGHTVLPLGTTVKGGAAVHDSATTTTTVNNIPSGSTVTFNLYSNSTCTAGVGTPTVVTTVGPEVAGVGALTSTDESGQVNTQALPLAPGNYAFQAVFTSGNTGAGGVPNATSPCEDFVVAAEARTKGFWQSPPGNADLDADTDGDIDTGPYDIGGVSRGAHVVNLDCSNAIEGPATDNFPALTGNGTPGPCEDGGDTVTTQDATLATGLSAGLVGNMAGQTLALTYNASATLRNLGGLTLLGAGCDLAGLEATLVLTTLQRIALESAPIGLTSLSTLSVVLAAANPLLNNTTSTSVPLATLDQVEAITKLLGQCVNQ
jgi:hypothetical protein